MIFSHLCHNWKKRRPHRRSLTAAQLVALARSTRELLPQPLWSCRTAIKITNNIVPNLKQATTKRLREQFAEGESDWSLRAVSPRLRGLRFFPKVSKAGRKFSSFTHRITIPTTPLTWCKTYIPSKIGVEILIKLLTKHAR